MLATMADDGRARLVPICFALVGSGDGLTLYSPLDEKPKERDDPLELARVRDVLARPMVSLLVDRWDEDWTRLAWLRIEAAAGLVEPGAAEHGVAVGSLRSRYPQYGTQRLETRPVIRLTPTRIVWWSAGSPRGEHAR